MSRIRSTLGEAAEDGLKAVYTLQIAQSPVSTSALAAELGVAEPTVTAMVKRLAKLELLSHVPYRGVVLTPAGERIALEIIRHHRLLELYLVEALGLGWEMVHAEAERLEHVISDEVEARMDARLGFPTMDPHGHPIPTRGGEIARPHSNRLADLQPGDRARVLSVPDRNPDLLQYLAQLGLVPDAPLQVVERAPFGGPLTVLVGDRPHALGRELAEAVLVKKRKSE